MGERDGRPTRDATLRARVGRQLRAYRGAELRAGPADRQHPNAHVHQHRHQPRAATRPPRRPGTRHCPPSSCGFAEVS